MPELPQASVVIATWNGLHHLRQCLPALMNQTIVEFETIVVDNGSTDGSSEWISRTYPRIFIERLESNHGFAEANNLGIARARAELIATLNNDARPEPDWLANLVEAADAFPDVGAFGSRVVLATNPTTLDSSGISTDVLGIAWDRGNSDQVGADAAEEVFGVSAAAALYRKELLNDTGGFDASYFAYLEDVDLAWRARWLGWKARHVPSACVVHARSATAGEDSPFKTFHLGRNKVWTIVKNHHGPTLLAYLPLAVLYDLASLPLTMLRQRSLAALHGRIAGIRSIGLALQKRRRVSGTRKSTWQDLRPLVENPSWPWTLWRRQQRLRISPKSEKTSKTP